jgi:hypothetical protein
MSKLETQYKNWQDANPQHSQVKFEEWKQDFWKFKGHPLYDGFRKINNTNEKRPIEFQRAISKPIFVIRFPDTLSMVEFRAIQESIRKNDVCKDYHVLTLKDGSTGDETKFECFNSPHTEIEFKELQEKILKLIECKNLDTDVVE